MTTPGPFCRRLLPQPLAYYKREELKLLGSGPWRHAVCPFHDDREPSLSIHVSSGGFNCHGCGAKGGDVLDFHRKRHKLGFKEAARALGAWEEPPTQAAQGQAPLSQRRTESAREAARRLATEILEKGFVPEGLHAYRDERGVALYYVIRAREPKTGKKWIRPMHSVGGHFRLGKPEFEHGAKPLYGLDLIAGRPEEVVLVCEGEKCADRLRKTGVLAITSGGATSAGGVNWTPLAGRRVIIWPDHDKPGQRYAKDVIHRLRDVASYTETIDTKELGLAEGEDAVDWLKTHPGATRETIFALPLVGS